MNNLEILYEDNHVIVVVKPFNVLSQGDATNDKDMLTIIKEYIKVKYNKPGNVYLGLVHRLDRPTKGIMVFAKTSKAASRLSNDIRLHQFNKNYVCLVHGKVKDKDILKDKISKDNDNNSYIDDFGKEAQLEYELLDYKKDISLVKVKLITGRHHQIRIQFASRNHPLVGDKRYGEDNYKQLMLIANELEFHHPVTKELMHFSIDYDELIKILNKR